jgi:hypothetical protein
MSLVEEKSCKIGSPICKFAFLSYKISPRTSFEMTAGNIS